MSGVTQIDQSHSVLRSPSLLRARPSVAGVAERTAQSSERALADFAAEVARLEAENTALRGEVALRDARLEEAAIASKATIDAKDAVIATQAAQIGDLTARLKVKEHLHEEMREKFQKLIRQCPPFVPINPGLEEIYLLSCQNSKLEQMLQKYFKVEISHLAQVFIPHVYEAP